MTAQAMDGRLRRARARPELANALEDMILRPKNGEGCPRGSRQGELKTYMLESNGGFPSRLESDGMLCEVEDAGLDRVKIMRARRGKDSTEFFLDMEDERFLRLHTVARAEDADRIVDALVRDGRHMFDNVWFHPAMLKRLADKQGSSFRSSGAACSDRFLRSGEGRREDADSPSGGGLPAKKIRDSAGSGRHAGRAAARGGARSMRGSGTDPCGSARDGTRGAGYFAAKRGKSVQDHLRLVDACKVEYSRTIAYIESLRIGTSEIEGKMRVAGGPFNFVFPDSIEDLDLFIDRMFNSDMPFNLWGMKFAIDEGYFKIMAIDLHANRPIDFEITKDFMRVYLFKGGCGNTLLRILANLQLHYDANAMCRQITDSPSGNAPD